MKNKSIINLNLPTNKRDATCVEFVNYRLSETQKNYLKLDGTTSMSGNLNLNNNKIINWQTDYRNSKSAANVDFVQEKITDLRDLVTQKIHESQIINSGQKRDAFRYLMEDTDESSSENNIKVLGISDFSGSPHQINKKAYSLQLLFEKDSPNQYRSRLGFNLYKLPVGYYGNAQLLIPEKSKINSMTVLYGKVMAPLPAISLGVNVDDFPTLTFASTKAISKQKININLIVQKGIFRCF